MAENPTLTLEWVQEDGATDMVVAVLAAEF